MQTHVAYCGAKTKECTECFSSVQSWMMTQHKESGQCANIMLDRAEANENDQIRSLLERSAFDPDDREEGKNNSSAAAVV